MMSSQSVQVGGESIPKWKIALAVGGVAALSVGVLWYLRRRTSTKTETEKEIKSDEVKEQDLVQTVLEKATAIKDKGNKFFKGGMFDKAIECYTEAIEICSGDCEEQVSTFYQNRAAAYEQLKNYEEVVKDCTMALEYNSKYIKALTRRAKAFERVENLDGCFEDITAVCLLEGFQNPNSIVMADRILKLVGKKKAKEEYKNRTVPDLPSKQFVKTYFRSFSNDPIMNGLSNGECEKYNDESLEKEEENSTEERNKKNSTFLELKRKLLNEEYDSIVDLCTEILESGDQKYLGEAYLLRATFLIFSGLGFKASADLDKVISMTDVNQRVKSNALIKRGSLKVQEGDQYGSLTDYDLAIKDDPDNCDIYLHRGQAYLTMEKLNEAFKDFDKSCSLNDNFETAHIQKCFAEYKAAVLSKNPMQLQEAFKAFESITERFPNSAEAHCLHAQAHQDQFSVDQAVECFNRAIEVEPGNANTYVHKGLLLVAAKQDIPGCISLIKEAMDLDDKCEYAYEMLGLLKVQTGETKEATSLFNKARMLAKSEAELAHIYSLTIAAEAQVKVAERLNVTLPSGYIPPE